MSSAPGSLKLASLSLTLNIPQLLSTTYVQSKDTKVFLRSHSGCAGDRRMYNWSFRLKGSLKNQSMRKLRPKQDKGLRSVVHPLWELPGCQMLAMSLKAAITNYQDSLSPPHSLKIHRPNFQVGKNSWGAEHSLQNWTHFQIHTFQ